MERENLLIGFVLWFALVIFLMFAIGKIPNGTIANIVAIVDGILWFAGGGVLFYLAWRHVYSYQITDIGIEVLFIGASVISIPFEQLVEVKKIDFTVFAFLDPGFPVLCINRIRRSMVLVRKRGGVYRNILITPDDTYAFLEEVSQRITLRANDAPV